MPSQNNPIEPSAFRELQRRVERLENETSRDAGRKLLTVDRLTTSALPAPSEGQLAIEHSNNKFKYYANSVWRETGGGKSVGPSILLSLASPQSISNNTPTSLTFTVSASYGYSTSSFDSPYEITNSTDTLTNDTDWRPPLYVGGTTSSVWMVVVWVEWADLTSLDKGKISTTLAAGGFSWSQSAYYDDDANIQATQSVAGMLFDSATRQTISVSVHQKTGSALSCANALMAISYLGSDL